MNEQYKTKKVTKDMGAKKRKAKKPVSDKDLLKLWAAIVKERAGWKCEYPGCTVQSTQIHPHHLFSRRYSAIRYDPINGICLCARHHTLGNEAAHLDPCFKEVIIDGKVRTASQFSYLKIKRLETVKNNQEFKNMWFNILNDWKNTDELDF